MGWEIGYDPNWKRDIGYGVPAVCDHPDCDEEIDRGLAYVCGGDVYGGELGCGLFFCDEHLEYSPITDHHAHIPVCERCYADKPSFDPKPDVEQWVHHKQTDPSWAEWRAERAKANGS